MKPDQFTEEHMIGVLRIYRKNCGPGVLVDRYIENPRAILENITSAEFYDGFAIGSNWDLRSKLKFSIDENGEVIPKFNPHLDPRCRGTESDKEATEAGEKFQKEALE